MSLLQRWREVALDYCATTPAAEERDHFFAAILFTLGTLGMGLGLAAFIGGLNG